MIPCPECNSVEVYAYERFIGANSSDGPSLLPKLGSNWLLPALFLPVVCKNCGLARFYASEEAREKLDSGHWNLLESSFWPDNSI
jgi:hypothetical protein